MGASSRSGFSPWAEAPDAIRFSLPVTRHNPLDGIYACTHIQRVDLIRIYQCLCDETRLRILHLLTRGPLCVCHLQELLDEPQVKISKHLAYLKEKGVAEVQRHQTWMIYSLPKAPSPELEANLKCLQDCVQTEPVFKRDLAKLKKLLPKVEWLADATDCCAEAATAVKCAKRP